MQATAWMGGGGMWVYQAERKRLGATTGAGRFRVVAPAPAGELVVPAALGAAFILRSALAIAGSTALPPAFVFFDSSTCAPSSPSPSPSASPSSSNKGGEGVRVVGWAEC
jgi:hypothetical protein